MASQFSPISGHSDAPVLTIFATTYTIHGIDTGTGGIEVHGDEIDFLASNLCNGVGNYHWSIVDDKLTLKPIGPDQCPGRALALRDQTFTRLG